jgi:predicted membrane-bound spermidine synthase
MVLHLIVFTSGMCVMAVEMTGLRLLAPYFGTSLIVTTALIGSLMGFLSLGYWLGGRWGDRNPTLPALSKVTAAAAVSILVIPFASRPILTAAAAVIRGLVQGEEIGDTTVVIASLVGGMIGVLALMALPITLMGTVSPWAIRLAVQDVQGSGQAAGKLYALSTFGSILGSFLPAVVLIPLLGVQRTYIFIGALFLGVSLIGMTQKAAARALPPAGALLLLLIPPGTVRPMEGLIYEAESLYHFIQVVQEPYGSCKDAYHLYLNEGVGVHSVKCPSGEMDKETRGVWTYMAATPLWLDEPDKLDEVMIIGLAGGTIARQMLEAFPEAHIDGVEIDGAVVEVGKRWFDDADPRIKPIVMDGRIFLNVTEKKYDLVMMDAYRQPYIPFHLVTVEFFREVRARMSDDAVLAVNVASVRGVSKGLAQMIYRTLKEVFPTVVLVEATQSNDVIIATTREKPMDIGGQRIADYADARGFHKIKDRLPQRIKGEVEGWQTARVLTDDQAPVEMAWDLMALDYAG